MASKAPVEAPDGTAARPVLPSSRPTSTSTVGLPRESRISRATTTSMDGTSISFLDVTRGQGLGGSARPSLTGSGRSAIRPPTPWTSVARARGCRGDRAELRLFLRGTKKVPPTVTGKYPGPFPEKEPRREPGHDPAPVRTGDHAPGRGARGGWGGPAAAFVLPSHTPTRAHSRYFLDL